MATLTQAQQKAAAKTGKKVSTSELIDWFTILRQYPEEEVLGKLNGELPFAQVLLKYWHDYREYLYSSQEERK